jgi:protein TonB
MFERLVESRNNNGENQRKAGFLLTTLFLVVSLLLVTFTYSLFAKDLNMNDAGLEFSALVAPVIEAEKPPPPPEQMQKPMEKTAAAATENNLILRKEAYAPIEKSINPPADTKGERDVQSWVKGAKIGPGNLNPTGASANLPSRDGKDVGSGININDAQAEKDVEPPPPIAPKIAPKTPAAVEEPKKDKKVTTVSGGVVNGKAVNLVKPQFSAAAKAVRASGAVNVQVTIDEKGNVISASAISGHQLLRPNAEQAARASKFSPTFLTGQPVKVTGFIVYNFTVQ